MVTVVGVRFKKAGKVDYFNPGALDIEIGDKVIVETSRGVEYGEVVTGPKDVRDEDIITPLKDVMRKATSEDEAIVKNNAAEALEAESIAIEKIEKHGLDMKLVDVEYTFDKSKLIFYFTADGRVDFRELVKDLASVFHTRIELRQIGVRDEAKMIGGIGPCGRCVCCSTFLGEFDPVSIKMAKQQNLSLNPVKISGLCGRLMCCLKYESESYEDNSIDYPNVGDRVITPYGEGTVIAVYKPKETIQVQIDEGKEIMEFPAEEVDIEEV
ncbi:stage 0 sporulation family protein [Tepidanaerobacter sp. EBM-38]|uniref:PSP1 domain-containing protein n=1 Tax=Tepidanaerobacter sp. EBM-38 TaxID=1918496 RepID=UPI000B27045F|nr:stage 0 sporulation family protein [Tepidanaerobacter sp. EBM-38]